jgi:hypothetical protein
MTIDTIALDGEESLARLDGTTVYGNARNAFRQHPERAAGDCSDQILSCP